ncbi:MAG: SIR2 family protein [Syntrophomonadaceae bacterium]|nr:SIR2 family protein [Syntrophomonadaceae bacterium]MDD4549333.1 SIR2 family protein [Syntrophomonadaceae bacterium]
MNKETFINKISDALYENRGVIFVGSGISKPSTAVDWFELLKPLADDLGIVIDNEHDDLPLIAQYIVNEYTGNRGPLINSISKACNHKFPLNNYHMALSTTKVSTIWTTNYDNLLERAFSDFLVDVKINDDAISRNVINSDVEILKIHGCILGSEHKDIIITQEDYEDFLYNKPATSQRLCNDLLKKSFLFIGYSYRDPNIKNIMITTRRLAQGHTQEHYLIHIKPQDENEAIRKEKERRIKLWCKDLKRLGITTLLIDDYNELEGILFTISQKSRGKTVYVTGSHEKGHPIAHSLGALLAKDREINLISGQSSGIGADVVSAFTEQCIKDRYDINDRLQIFPNPYAANPNFSNDPTLLPELKKSRAKLMNSTQVVIIFNGGMGTEAEFEVAKDRNCKILPVIQCKEDLNSKVLKTILEDPIIENLKRTDHEYFEKLRAGYVSVEDIILCVKKMLG